MWINVAKLTKFNFNPSLFDCDIATWYSFFMHTFCFINKSCSLCLSFLLALFKSFSLALLLFKVETNMVEYRKQAWVSRPKPYILKLRNDLKCSSQADVIRVGQALQQRTQLGANDVCFQAFYILTYLYTDINLPKQCVPARKFIQRVFCEMKGSQSTPLKFHTVKLASK